jgi:dephospho-CoA kinase
MQQNKKALVFVGMPGAGKSTCVEYLQNFGYSALYFGKITFDELTKRHLEINPPNEKIIREEIRQKEGKGAYALRILTKIEELFEKGQNTVIVDGLYSWTEYKIFKESLGSRAIIIAIVSPRELRHLRLQKRAVRPLNEEEADLRDYAEIENIEKGGPIANADYYLANDLTVDDLTKDLRKLLNSLAISI